MQGDAVGDIGVDGSEQVGVLGTERVACMGDGLECWNARDLAALHKECELVESLDLEDGLALSEGVQVSGLMNTGAVVGEGGEPVLVYCLRCVAVVVVVEGHVPVRAVETDTVSEDLDRGGWTAVRFAVGRGESNLLGKGGVLPDLVSPGFRSKIRRH